MNRFSAILAAVLIALVSPWAVTRQCPDQTVVAAGSSDHAEGLRKALLATEQGRATVLDFQRHVAENGTAGEEENEDDRDGDAEVWGVTGLGAKGSSFRSVDEGPATLQAKLSDWSGQESMVCTEILSGLTTDEGIAAPRRWRHIFHAGSNDPPTHTTFWERIVIGKTANTPQIEGTPIACHGNHDCVVEESTT